MIWRLFQLLHLLPAFPVACSGYLCGQIDILPYFVHDLGCISGWGPSMRSPRAWVLGTTVFRSHLVTSELHSAGPMCRTVWEPRCRFLWTPVAVKRNGPSVNNAWLCDCKVKKVGILSWRHHDGYRWLSVECHFDASCSWFQLLLCTFLWADPNPNLTCFHGFADRPLTSPFGWPSNRGIFAVWLGLVSLLRKDPLKELYLGTMAEVAAWLRWNSPTGCLVGGQNARISLSILPGSLGCLMFVCSL